MFDDNNLQGAEGSLSPEASDAEGDTHNLPDTTPEELLGGHKMRHFQESYPDRREGRGEFLFPARTRIIKGGFHQLGSLADISAVGIFPPPIIPGREVETATRWSVPFHSRWHNVLPRVPFPPLKGLREPEESQGGPVRVPPTMGW